MKNIISLTVGDPNFMMPSFIRKAAQKALEEGHTHYTPTTGLPELKELISEKLDKENNIETDPASEVIVTAGATPAMFGAIHAFIESKDEVIVADPTYKFSSYTRYAGGKSVLIPLKEEYGFRLNPEEVKEAITSKTKMIVVISPDNPTGAVLRKEDLKAIADIAIDKDLLVISDQVYEKIVFNNHKHYSLASFPGMEDRTITIGSFSKTYSMTGMRVGYLTADREATTILGKVVTSMTICPNSIAQEAAIAALKEKELSRKWIEEMMIEYRKRRDLLIDGLNEISGISISRNNWGGSIFAFANIKPFNTSSYHFAMQLLKKGSVLVHPGTAFGKGGEGYIRVSIASSIATLEEGLSRIKKVIEENNI